MDPDGSSGQPIVISSDLDSPASPVKVLTGGQFRSFVESFSEEESDDKGLISCRSDESSDETPASPTRNSMGVPIYERPLPKYTAIEIMQLLLNPNIDKSRVAKSRPVQVEESSAFIVDLTCLKHPDDVKKDMYGRWEHSGSHPEVFHCVIGDFDTVEIEKCAPGATGSNVYFLRRLRSCHPSNSEFRRVIAFVHDHNNQPHKYCLVVYYLPKGFSPQALPHGNCKSTRPFYPTLPSTMQKMKEECVKGYGPKKVVSDVSASVGGIMSASDSCELPRSEQQVAKMKGRMKLSSTDTSYDEFAIILQQAFMEDKCSQFIREVKCLREPAIIVATERQLNDIVRLCTVPGQFSVMTIDPTFCLGDFDVTVITYRHMLLISRQVKQPPAIIGPVLIHYKKSFSTYLFFSSALVGLRREFCNIKCFGTDGESALIEAFQHSCPGSINLLCSIHCKKNVKAKLQELGVSEHSRKLILDDIFGKKHGTHYSEGLVDTWNELMYDKAFASLTKMWKQYIVTDSVHNAFVQWFKKYKSEIIKKSMLRSVREKAGLGSPPIPFTTNASESVNAVLKRKVDYKRSELPVFLDSLKELIQEQDNQISRALIGRGNYMVDPKFKKFQKTEEEWFTKMKEAERTRHLQRFASFHFSPSDSASCSHSESSCSSRSFPNSILSSSSSCFSGSSLQSEPTYSTTVPSSSLLSEPSCSYHSFPSDHEHPTCQVTDSESEDDLPPRRGIKRRLFQSPEPSIPVSEVVGSISVPEMVLTGIWSKATELLSAPNAISKAPGLDMKAHTVVSFSGNRHHLVSCKKTGQYICDKACGNWNSLGICSHTVAVAEINNDLSSFISWYQKAKKKPSLTKLVLTGMPDGRGEKGGKSARHKKKSQAIITRTPIGVLSATTETESIGSLENPSVTGPLNPPSDEIISPASAAYKVPSHPPPLVHITPHGPAPTVEPFMLCFISGNISVCYGCRQRYQRPCQPPHDLCVRHKEWREFFPSGAATKQTRFCNVYYHCNTPCIQARCPFFKPDQLIIPAMMAAQMLPVHTSYIEEHMPRTTEN